MAALAAAACLVGALVVTIVLGALQATQQRATAEAWLAPQRVTMEDAGAILRAADRYIDGQRFTVVRYAPIPGRTAPVPPGLDEAPRPGEVFASAAAAKVGAPELEGKTITGELGEEALRSPDDRIIVIGEAPDSPVMTEPGFVAQSGIGANQPPTPIAAFGGEPHRLNSASETTNYVHLTAIAAVLLIGPVLSLMGAAARLGNGRRNRRVALLRLGGMSRRQAIALTSAEAAVPAFAGALAGVAAAVPVAAALSYVPLQGRTFGLFQLMPSPAWLAGVVPGVVALAVVSALLQVRPAIADPLGVADAHAPKSLSWLRWGVIAAAGYAWYQVSKPGSDGGGVLPMFAALAMAMSLIGPVLTSLAGKRLVSRFHRGRGGVRALLAGRRLVDDPRAAWRMVSGVAFAAFIAGFFAGFGGGDGQVVWGREHVLEVPVTQQQAAEADATLGRARAALAAASPAAAGTVTLGERGSVVGFDEHALDGTAPEQVSYLSVQVELPADDPDGAEAIRGALAAEFPAAPQLTGGDILADEQNFAVDMPRASIIVLAIGFLVAATATAVTAASDVLDGRARNRRLRSSGVGLDVIDGARGTEMNAILASTIAPALGLGLFLGLPLSMSAGGTGLLQVGMVAVAVVLGIAAMKGAVRLSAGLLDSTSRP